jgi:hypothetical protein
MQDETKGKKEVKKVPFFTGAIIIVCMIAIIALLAKVVSDYSSMPPHPWTHRDQIGKAFYVEGRGFKCPGCGRFFELPGAFYYHKCQEGFNIDHYAYPQAAGTPPDVL